MNILKNFQFAEFMSNFFKITTFICLLFLAGCANNINKKMVSSTPTTVVTQKIALFLPLTGSYGGSGEAVRDGFMASYYQAGSPKNIDITVYDTSKNSISNLYQQALAKHTRIIVGPLDKLSLQQLAQLTPEIPVLALNYLPKMQKQLGQIIQFGLSPQNEAQQIAQKAIGSGVKRIVMIYPSSDWGRGIAQAFIQTWQGMGGTIATAIPYLPHQDFTKAIPNAFGIVGKSSARISFDSIFLVASPDDARQIIDSLAYFNISQPIYSISDIYSGLVRADLDKNFNHVVFADMPFVLNSSTALSFKNNFSSNNPSEYAKNIRLYALGMDAYYLTRHYVEVSNNSHFKYNGYTGTLTIHNRAVIRLLSFATFVNGVPQLL